MYINFNIFNEILTHTYITSPLLPLKPDAQIILWIINQSRRTPNPTEQQGGRQNSTKMLRIQTRTECLTGKKVGLTVD
jgi:hypothetical protein